MNDELASNAAGANLGLGEFLGRSRRAWLHDAIRSGMRDSPSANEVMDAMHGPEAPPPAGEGAWAGIETVAGAANVIDAATLTIWLSAGPEDGNGSCDMDNNVNCRLYKVTWNLATRRGSASLLMDLTGLGFAVVQPAVDRSGRRLAAVLSYGWDEAGGWPVSTSLAAWIPGASYLIVDPQERGALRPEDPTWADSGALLWGGNAQGNSEVGWWGNLHESLMDANGHKEYVIAGGPDGSNAEDGNAPCAMHNTWPSGDCVSWRDPDAYRDPPGLAPGLWVTAFGKHGIASKQEDSKPIVASIGFPQQLLNVNLGRGRDDERIVSCHHPAWNVTGTEILCTRQFHPDKTSVLDLEVRALYGYRFNGTGWASPREVVESRDLRLRFPTQLKHVHDGDLLTYKYGHWCGSDRYVVATVFGQTKDGQPVITSRVMLFDTGSTPAGVWDLTDVVEDVEGVSRGTWRAIFSTCAASD